MGLEKMLLISFVLICGVTAGKHDIYSGFTVHIVEVNDISQQRVLSDLQLSLDVDIWRQGSPGRVDARIMLSPENRVAVLDELDANGMSHYLDIANVVTALEEFDEQLTQYQKSRSDRLVPFENYPRYEEVNAYLDRIATEHPDIVTLVNAGPTFEGRDVKYLKISTSNFQNSSKPVYFMNSMLHAREWVTTPVALYAIHRLVELRAEDRDLLEDTDWIIMPLVNADGYEYSHTDDRLWRRTRSVNLNVSTTCVGVDANRNFDVNFATVGVSTDPCSDVYPGHVAFSERETGYVRDIILEHLNRIQLYMDVHSFGNMVLFAYGNGTVPDNGFALHHVAALMGATMDTVKLPEADGFYWIGNSALLLYLDSGTAPDYAQLVGIPLAYTIELPSYGFDFRVPPHYIQHINEETWLGIAATARVAKLHYDARNVN